MTTALIWAGSALAIIGLLMLGWCIWRGLAIRKAGQTETATSEMQKLIAINMAAVGIAFIGLAMVVVGYILLGRHFYSSSKRGRPD